MAIRISRPVKRWAQMTYTSADSPDAAGPGGWGVKETTSDLTTPMVDRLMSGVCTSLDGVPGLTRFPSDEELDARPRRLAYRLVEGRVTLWHAVEAGNDASGRPGNVFAHVAAERDEGPAIVPIEYWRSADWLVPFGAPEVARAKVPSSLRPNGAVNRDAFLDFIGIGDRLFVLRWLLDAVAWAVRTSSSTVLITETADEAASWMAAFSYLTSPQLGRRITFVTFERVHTLQFALQQGFHIICVPRVDSERLLEMREPFLLLDPRWELDEREAAKENSWRLPTGRSMPTTRWQEWALDLASLDREHAVAVLAATEQVGGQLPPAADVPLQWPLSLAMMLDQRSVIMARAEKIQEILGSTPAELLNLPACTSLMDEFVSSLGTEGWCNFVETNRDKAALREFATVRRLLLALRQSSGTVPGIVLTPVSLTGRSKAELRRPALEAVARADQLSAGGTEDVLEAARIASLLLGFQLQPIPDNDADIPPLEPVLDRIQLRLREPEFASRHEEIAQFHPLLTSTGAHRGRPLPQVLPPNHSAGEPDPAPPIPRNFSVGPPIDVGPADQMDESGESLLRNLIAKEIALIFHRLPAGTAECAVLARAVYLAAGLKPGVLPTVDDLETKPFLALACANNLVGPNISPRLLLEHSAQIVALSREPSTSWLEVQPGLSLAIQTVLTCLATLESLQKDSCLTEPNTLATVAGHFKAREETHIAALMRMFDPGQNGEAESESVSWAARMIFASAQAVLLGERSVLTVPTSGGDCLGGVVSRRLAKSRRFSPAELVAEVDKNTRAIADKSTRDRVDDQIYPLFAGSECALRPVIDENAKRS